ncbi:hypothetical protein ACU635_14050 [[Actinomadura] parvosata]|uniref:hypothetical protein n=1 Tax=[Actinomadura] parvosata TaxID=1955412 RepID=UPI00406BF63E
MIAYSAELVTDPIEFEPYAGKLRLAYKNPKAGDWVKAPSASAWEPGILRARVRDLRDRPATRGPERMRKLHVRRQWRCMDKLLCQVCALPAADRQTGLIPWLLTRTAFEATGLRSGRTNAPPTCARCIPKALEECPMLRSSVSLCTVEGVKPAGVLADMYRPGIVRTLESTGRNVFVAWDDYQHHPYALATSQMVELQGIRPVPS